MIYVDAPRLYYTELMDLDGVDPNLYDRLIAGGQASLDGTLDNAVAWSPAFSCWPVA
jgi:hypothetical protein